MADVISAIGVISGVLGIIGFFQSNLPGGDAPASGAVVKIKLGLPQGDDDAEIGGDIDAVYGWDGNNNYLGQGAGGYRTQADILETTVDSSSPGARAEYVGVSAGDDGICIAWITVLMKDTTRGGAWTGDIGFQCGEKWYESNESAGRMNASDDQSPPYKPRCTWLDGDHTENTPRAALKFRSLAYGEQVEDTVNSDKSCAATVWGDDTGPINVITGKRDTPALNMTRLPWMEERLVVSNFTGHTAGNLCSSATSWGPDFIGSDGYFCDMGSKTMTPLCSTLEVDGCYDINHADQAITKRTTVGRRSVKLAEKSYTKISYWS